MKALPHCTTPVHQRNMEWPWTIPPILELLQHKFKIHPGLALGLDFPQLPVKQLYEKGTTMDLSRWPNLNNSLWGSRWRSDPKETDLWHWTCHCLPSLICAFRLWGILSPPIPLHSSSWIILVWTQTLGCWSVCKQWSQMTGSAWSTIQLWSQSFCLLSHISFLHLSSRLHSPAMVPWSHASLRNRFKELLVWLLLLPSPNNRNHKCRSSKSVDAFVTEIKTPKTKGFHCHYVEITLQYYTNWTKCCTIFFYFSSLFFWLILLVVDHTVTNWNDNLIRLIALKYSWVSIQGWLYYSTEHKETLRLLLPVLFMICGQWKLHLCVQCEVQKYKAVQKS